MSKFSSHNFRARLYRLTRFPFPFSLLNPAFNRLGISFQFYGDEIIWVYPWKRVNKGKYISLGFSGDGSFGDAWFNSLKEIKLSWDQYFKDEREWGKSYGETKFDLFS